MEQFSIDGTKIILNLAKNPAGFNQNISAVMEDPSDKDLIIVINDNAQDGTDISWLWDVDFERFFRSLCKICDCKRNPLSGYAASDEICGYPLEPGGGCGKSHKRQNPVWM